MHTFFFRLFDQAMQQFLNIPSQIVLFFVVVALKMLYRLFFSNLFQFLTRIVCWDVWSILFSLLETPSAMRTTAPVFSSLSRIVESLPARVVGVSSVERDR